MDWITPQLVIEVIVLPALAYIARQISAYNQERKKREAELRNTLHLIVRAEMTNSRTNITQEVSRFVEQGHCSRNDRYNIDHLVRIYHQLGGNGTIDDYLRALKKLPDTETVVKKAKDDVKASKEAT